MKTQATFYHAGCPICVNAEENVANALDRDRYDLTIVHLGEQPEKIAEAKENGVESVPVLVLGGEPFHINFGAALSDLA